MIEYYKNRLNEMAAPGKEKWASNPKVKASFKKQYGNRWKQVMYGHSWNMKENNEMVLNELGDTPAGKAALTRYLMKREPHLEKGVQVIQGLTSKTDAMTSRLISARLSGDPARMDTAMKQSSSLLKYGSRVKNRVGRMSTGMRRALTIVDPENKDLLNELGDTLAGRRALMSYVSKRNKQTPSRLQAIRDVGDNIQNQLSNISREAVRRPNEATRVAEKTKGSVSKLGKLIGKQKRYEKGIKRAIGILTKRS